MFERLTRSGRQAWHDLKADEAQVDGIVTAWERACEGAGLSRSVSTVSGPTVLTPRIVELTLGPPLWFVVQLLHGQLPTDIRSAGERIAPWLGGQRLRVAPMGGGVFARVEVITSDPLDRVIPQAPMVDSALEPIRLGADELGDDVAVRLGSAAHLIVQGASGSGKSVGMYGLLGQLAAAPDVIVAGSDITDLLLAPWCDHPRSRGWQATGTGQPVKHVEIMERLVAMMDGRIARMPARRDSVELGPATPLVVAVLEEYPGLLRVLRAKDKALEARARTAVGRLLAEGRKAGLRVLIITQRADADIIGGYERGQASHKISFRVDTMAALKMLHADLGPELADAHATAPAGVALMSAPGVPLTRLRAPLMTFADYFGQVETGARWAA
jgi:S-DNA-T family DNA segregation ATPase FtsK/SpoIIIE